MEIQEKLPIGEEFIKRKILTKKEVNIVLNYQEEHPDLKFGEIVDILDMCDKEALLEVLSSNLEVKSAIIERKLSINPLNFLPSDIIITYRALPFEKVGNTICVAFANPQDTEMVEYVRKLIAKEGYDIAVNYRTENDDLVNTKAEIEKLNVQCFAVQGDVSDFDSTEKMVKDIIEKFGQIDVLVNNAGITKDMLLMRMKKEDFESVIDVNLVGTFNVTKNTIPYMMKQKSGRIINLSSVVGISGNAGQTNYSASKAGIIGFTKSLAKEVGSRNILVNAVAPGFIQTQMTDVLKDEVKEEISKNIPLKRMGNTSDVANVVKFLASDEASYVNNSIIRVDGGSYHG